MTVGSDPVFAVSEFVEVFNQTLETTYPRVGIVGELANFKISRNQWVYLDLKDEGAVVKFFGTTRQLPGPLEDGLILEIYGRPRLHPQYGFSINIETVRVSGKGSIKKAQDLLARKLEAEGLFDASRKRVLPYAPSRIGLISSLDSAAVADFRKIIDARWGSISIMSADVKVQGNESPDQIVGALKDFNQLADQPEVLVIIRGGGSPEDLSSFSDERVVRAVSASRIPTLVAVGHELDVSLSELAADMRASTPSNAAEILVPDREHEKRMLGMWLGKIKDLFDSKLQALSNDLVDSSDFIGRLTESILSGAQQQLEHSKSVVGLLDPQAPLRRGYAITRNNTGQVIKSPSKVKKGETLSISLIDGTIKSKVESVVYGKKR